MKGGVADKHWGFIVWEQRQKEAKGKTQGGCSMLDKLIAWEKEGEREGGSGRTLRGDAVAAAAGVVAPPRPPALPPHPPSSSSLFITWNHRATHGVQSVQIHYHCSCHH